MILKDLLALLLLLVTTARKIVTYNKSSALLYTWLKKQLEGKINQVNLCKSSQQCFRVGPPYTTKVVAIFDYSKFTRKNSDLELAKVMISVMNKYYPERLRRVFVINQPWTLSLLWSVVEPLLDPDTRKKITFVKKQEELGKSFAEDHLLTEYGGSSEITPGSDPLGFGTLDSLK